MGKKMNSMISYGCDGQFWVSALHSVESSGKGESIRDFLHWVALCGRAGPLCVWGVVPFPRQGILNCLRESKLSGGSLL